MVDTFKFSFQQLLAGRHANQIIHAESTAVSFHCERRLHCFARRRLLLYNDNNLFVENMDASAGRPGSSEVPCNL